MRPWSRSHRCSRPTRAPCSPIVPVVPVAASTRPTTRCASRWISCAQPSTACPLPSRWRPTACGCSSCPSSSSGWTIGRAAALAGAQRTVDARHDAGHDRLELPPARPSRTGDVRSAGHVPGRMRSDGGRGRVPRQRRPLRGRGGRRSRRQARRPLARRSRSRHQPDSFPHARHDPPLRRRPPRRAPRRRPGRRRLHRVGDEGGHRCCGGAAHRRAGDVAPTVEAELDNLRVAFERAVAAGRVEALEMANTLSELRLTRGEIVFRRAVASRGARCHRGLGLAGASAPSPRSK